MKTLKTEGLVGVAMHVLFASSVSLQEALDSNENRTENPKGYDHVDPP